MKCYDVGDVLWCDESKMSFCLTVDIMECYEISFCTIGWDVMGFHLHILDTDFL